MSRWQYQSRAEPVQSQSELTQIDKWEPKYPSVLRKSRFLATAILAGSCFIPPDSEVVTCNKWIGEYPNQINKVKSTLFRGPNLFVPVDEVATCEKWLGVFPSRIEKKKPVTFTESYPFVLDPKLDATCDRWGPIYPNILNKQKSPLLAESSFFVPVIEAIIETVVTCDKWIGSYPNIINKRKPITIIEFCAFSPLVEKTVTCDKWIGEYPDRLNKPTPISLSGSDFFLYPIVIISETVVTCDKWIGSYPNIVRRNKRFLGDESICVEPFPLSTTIRVNCGGSSYIDTNGNFWSEDYGYNLGISYGTADPIANTVEDTLYQRLRYHTAAFQYKFNGLKSGIYSVTLKFAETHFTVAGQRVFNVIINGVTVLTSFDVIVASGGHDRAYDRTFETTTTNGQITIQFTLITNYPIINAIEIIELPSASALFPVYPNQLYPVKRSLWDTKYTEDLSTIAIVEQINISKWHPTYPTRLNRKSRILHRDWSSTSGFEVITSDKWTPNYPNRLDAKKRTFWSGQFLIDPLQLASEETPFVEKWNPVYPNILLRKRRIFPMDFGIVDPFMANVVDPAELIKNYYRRYLQDVNDLNVAIVATTPISGVSTGTLGYFRRYLRDLS